MTVTVETRAAAATSAVVAQVRGGGASLTSEVYRANLGLVSDFYPMYIRDVSGIFPQGDASRWQVRPSSLH